MAAAYNVNAPARNNYFYGHDRRDCMCVGVIIAPPLSHLILKIFAFKTGCILHGINIDSIK